MILKANMHIHTPSHSQPGCVWKGTTKWGRRGRVGCLRSRVPEICDPADLSEFRLVIHSWQVVLPDGELLLFSPPCSLARHGPNVWWIAHWARGGRLLTFNSHSMSDYKWFYLMLVSQWSGTFSSCRFFTVFLEFLYRVADSSWTVVVSKDIQIKSNVGFLQKYVVIKKWKIYTTIRKK